MLWPKSVQPVLKMETLNEDFLEFIRLLRSEGVAYLIDANELQKG